jgi:2,3-diketo-5-methylthio-1-phosphopentane phosphatase
MSCHVFVDFDGTIVPCDATDLLFDRFAPEEWRVVEEEWQAGRIGSRECLARQASLMQATPSELDAAVDTLDIDPGFKSFLRMCRERGVSATVVSDGFDRVIERVLHRHGVIIPYIANRLEQVGRDGWRVSFPNVRDDCRVLAGHCKCSSARRDGRGRGLKVVVGDGRSDFCLSGEADLVFAKSKLLELCRSNGTPHVTFEDFFDVAEHMVGWLELQRKPAKCTEAFDKALR